jgi:hypothetical protein
VSLCRKILQGFYWDIKFLGSFLIYLKTCTYVPECLSKSLQFHSSQLTKITHLWIYDMIFLPINLHPGEISKGLVGKRKKKIFILMKRHYKMHNCRRNKNSSVLKIAFFSSCDKTFIWIINKAIILFKKYQVSNEIISLWQITRKVIHKLILEMLNIFFTWK